MSERLDYLKYRVLVRIDELQPGVAPAEPIEGMDKELDDAALYLLRNLQRELLLDAGKFDPDPYCVLDGYRLMVGLPDDYLRLLRLRVKGWTRDVDWLTSTLSPEYAAQNNEYTRAGTGRPVASLVPWHHKKDEQTTFTKAIECYPATKHGEKIETFLYVPVLTAAEIPELLEDPLLWIGASRVLINMRETELAAQAMGQMAQSVMSIRHGILGETQKAESDG